jgi:hypothetical protein
VNKIEKKRFTFIFGTFDEAIKSELVGDVDEDVDE